MSHVDRLNQDPPHLGIANISTLKANAEVKSNELAICRREPRRDVGELIGDVQPDWKAIARQQS